jgi:hypothetical protein
MSEERAVAERLDGFARLLDFEVGRVRPERKPHGAADADACARQQINRLIVEAVRKVKEATP